MVNCLNRITKKKIYFTKFMSFIVVFLMISNTIFPVTCAVAKVIPSIERPAKTIPLHNGHIALRGDGSIFVKVGDEECSIRVTKAPNMRTVKIKNEKNGDVDKLIFNTKAGTVYSTYTGKTVNVEMFDHGVQDESLAQKNSQHKQVGSVVVANNSNENFSRDLIRISWKQIRDSLGWLAHRAGLVGLLIGCSGGGSIALAAFNAVGFILKKIGCLIPDETSHGIAIVYKTATACSGIRNGLCISGNKVISVRQY